MQSLHDRLLSRLNTPAAGWWLGYAAVLETLGSFVRADLLLADAVQLTPKAVLEYITLTVLGSVLAGGGLYALGAAAGQLWWWHHVMAPWWPPVAVGIQAYAPLLVLAAGVATIPFAFLLIVAGLFGAAPLWLLPAAVCARLVRYGLMAWLLWRGGTRYRDWLLRYYHGLTMVVALGLLLMALFGLLLKYI
jgi:hypothetical protein